MKPLSRSDIIAVMVGGAAVYRVGVDIQSGRWVYAAVGTVFVILLSIVISGIELAYQLRDVDNKTNRHDLATTPCFDMTAHPPHEWTVPYTGTVPGIKVPVYQCPGKDYTA